MVRRDDALSALQALDPRCNREQWVRIAMAAKDAGLDLDDFTTWSETAPNHGTARESATVWHSIKDGAVTAGTLYHMAQSVGWQRPGKPREAHYNPPTRRARDHHADNAPQSQQRPAYAAAVTPAELWQRCEPATDGHPYIVAKRGIPCGLRVVRADDDLRVSGHAVAGWLVVPARSLDGAMHTLQLIPPPGECDHPI